MMQVVPGSYRWFCRVVGCDVYTRHNIPYGYCDEHTRRVVRGETFPAKLGYPAMGTATLTPAIGKSVDQYQEIGSATETPSVGAATKGGE